MKMKPRFFIIAVIFSVLFGWLTRVSSQTPDSEIAQMLLIRIFEVLFFIMVICSTILSWMWAEEEGGDE